jgi:hypothetical protein
MTASVDSWEIMPAPVATVPLGFMAMFSADEAALIREGFLPETRRDAWFIYYANGWLHLHRSWTGACIFGMQVRETDAGMRVTKSWVSREPAEYVAQDIGYERLLLRYLIDTLLLRKETAILPTPPQKMAARPGMTSEEIEAQFLAGRLP